MKRVNKLAEMIRSRVWQRQVSLPLCGLVVLGVSLASFALGTRLHSVAFDGVDYGGLREVYSVLKQNFDGKLDQRKLAQGAMKGMVDGVGDPYTVYLTQSESKDLTDDLSGSFEGIGIAMGLTQDRQIQIISAIDGSPAAQAGLKGGDIVTGIDGVSAAGMTPADAAKKIRGRSGTTVKLTVMRDGKTLDYTVKRDKILTPSVTWRKDGEIGYMRVSQFGADTASLARQAATELTKQGIKSLVVDIRDNVGGYVDAAQELAGLWLDSNNLVVQERRGQQVLSNVNASGEPILKNIKTAVLINGGSASSSEIFAGALHDYNRAILVGEKSYGKGCVQQIIPLTNGDQLKVTVAKWYTPKGMNISKAGIKPDYEVKFDAAAFRNGRDNQLDQARALLQQH